MSKTGTNPVPREQLESIARAEGCTLEQMAACVKVTKGKSSNRLYITNPAQCARVDVSNFDYPDRGVVRDLGGESFGKVHQMVRFDRPAGDILRDFHLLCRGLDAFESHPKKERQSPASFKGSRRRGENLGPSVEVQSEETPAQHAERLIKHYGEIKRYAQMKGVGVSKKTTMEFTTKVAALGFRLEA